MNSTEEISRFTQPHDYCRNTLARGCELPQEKPTKKKWSIGNLFRRKKKEESESSSEDDRKRGFLGRRRRKSEGKKRKPKTIGGFDHIVLPRASYRPQDDLGILSDPSGAFPIYVGNESIPKKKGRELAKARVVARRTTLGNESSSEEDSSLNSSIRVRSDESLAFPEPLLHSRRSRAARTERYLKRHSKDGENPHNYLRLSKSDADRSPSPFRRSEETIPKFSNSTSNPSYKPPLSMNDYNRSWEGDGPMQQRQRYYRQPPQPPPRDFNNRPMFHRPTTINFDYNGRSASELNIPQNNRNCPSPRPASTTPEPKQRLRHTVDGYNYLADKRPRSRKPIVIESPTQKALDFWKQIEESVNKALKPQIFTSQTHLHSQVFIPQFDQVPKDDPMRKSTNLEEALDELEAIYNSLKLGDENLLDRAEEKENQSLAKQAKELRKANSEVKIPKIIPDTKHDDMYNRRLAKEKSATISDPQSMFKKVSYLLNSPTQHAYDSENELRKYKRNKQPDTTFDDLSYRYIKRPSPKTIDPQPPFGIPVSPASPAPSSDYLHATPKILETELTLPDIVKDDLAYRNLRKDDKKLDLNYLKKRRAVRSLSANIGNILDNGGEERKLADIADAMEIARRVLKEKGKDICETNKAFMSDSDVKLADTFRESRMRFLNELKQPKESSLDDLLNAMAEEAKVTTERISLELKQLEEKRRNETSIGLQKAENNELIHEMVEEMTIKSPPPESANIVQSCFKDSSEERKNDYESIDSELDLEKIEQDCQLSNKDSIYDSLEGELNYKQSNVAKANQQRLDALDKLKSPKLVMDTMHDIEKLDFVKVAIACTYSLACAHQLASLDFVALLNLLFVVMSFIVALFL